MDECRDLGDIWDRRQDISLSRYEKGFRLGKWTYDLGYVRVNPVTKSLRGEREDMLVKRVHVILKG